MKRIFSLLLCLALLCCGAQAEADDILTFTSHYDRYTLSLPGGSAHYSVYDAARLSGSTPASLHFNEVDCYGVGTAERINLQTTCTPFGAIFRADMLEYSDSMVASFIRSYVSFGYAENALDIAMETVGEYPFVRIDVKDDPSAITEYYTYGSTGTEFYFAFLGTSRELEHEILASLQLAEPTEIVADYTETNMRDKAKKKLHSRGEDPFADTQGKVSTSHFGAYDIQLPGGAVHFSSDSAARHFGITEKQVVQSKMDCYSVFDDGYIDMISFITPDMGIFPSDLTKNRLRLLDNTRDAYEALDTVDPESLQLSVEAVGEYHFLRVRCVMTDSSGSMDSLDYFTYDDNGTEYYFQFYDFSEEDAEALLETLVIHPLKAAETDASRLSDRARGLNKERNGSLSGQKSKAESIPSAEEQTDAPDPEKTGFTLDTPTGIVRLPDSMAERTMQAAYEYALATDRSTTLWDEREERGTEFCLYTDLTGSRMILIATFQTLDHTREELENRDRTVIDVTRQDLIDEGLNPDDYLLSFDAIGDHPCQVTESLIDGDQYIEFCTVSRGGVQYNIAFTGFTPEEARAIMTTLEIHE